MQVSICHATVEGQTGNIVRFVADCVSGAGHTPLMFDVGDERAHADFDDIDRVILAAPVHERRHPRGFELRKEANIADLIYFNDSYTNKLLIVRVFKFKCAI